MKNITISTILALSLVFLFGCGSAISYTPMTLVNRNAIKDVNLYNLVIQDEVKPSVEISSASLYLGGGLLGAAIDSSVNKGRSLTAQDIIEPLYNATENLDYRKMSASTVTPIISKEFNLKEPQKSAEAVLLTDAALKEKVYNLPKGEALLYLSNFYNLLDNSKTLSLDTVAFVYLNPLLETTSELNDKSENGNSKKVAKTEKKPEPKLVYFNRFSFQSEPIGEGAEHSIELWSKDGGKLFEDTIKEGITDIANMLVYDLQPVLQETCFSNVKVDLPTLSGNTVVKGKLVEQKTTRAVVRAEYGALLSFAGKPIPVKQSKTKEACAAKEI